MQFYDQLQQQTETARRSLLAVSLLQRGARGELTLDEYVAFLTQAYHHVKHTVPLLMACGSRLDEKQEWLREAIAEYIEEETGHQAWVLNDIAACGADAQAVRSGAPNFSTELMVAYAYDTIARGNPVGFLGMVYVLEGMSVLLATRAAGSLQRSLELPAQAFHYLYSHGGLDVNHVEFFRELVDRLDDETDRQAVLHAARMFFRLYGDIFRAIGRAREAAHAA